MAEFRAVAASGAEVGAVRTVGTFAELRALAIAAELGSVAVSAELRGRRGIVDYALEHFSDFGILQHLIFFFVAQFSVAVGVVFLKECVALLASLLEHRPSFLRI